MKTHTDFSFYLSEYFHRYIPNQLGFSPNTLKTYKYAFLRYIDFLEGIKSINSNKIELTDFNYDNVTEFLEWLNSSKAQSTNTSNNRLAAIKGFLKFVKERDPSYLNIYIQISDIRTRKSKRKIPGFLLPEEIKKLLKIPNQKNRWQRRDLIMLTTLFETGIRASELLNLKVSSLILNSKPWILVLGKGNKERLIPISVKLSAHLKEYIKREKLNINQDTLDSPLFFNHRMERITTPGLHYIIKKYVNLLDITPQFVAKEEISPHTFRHSKAMQLVNLGWGIEVVKDILGHESITTTQLYLSANSKLKRDSIEETYLDIIPTEKPIWVESPTIKSWLKNI